MSLFGTPAPAPLGNALTPTSRERATDHIARMEATGGDESYQLLPQLATRFSLLPASPPPIEQREWRRENEFATIKINAGDVYDRDTNRWVPGRLPGGGYSNLIMLSLLARVREQARRGEDPRRVDLTPTLNRYSTDLGLSRGGRTQKVLMEALQSTLGASIQLNRADEETRDGVTGVRLQMARADIAAKYSLWVPSQSPLRGMEPFVEVSDFMVELACAPGAVPARLDLIAQLAGKPYAQQALLWLSREVFRLDRQGGDEVVYEWADLYRNITHDMERMDLFQRHWRRALEEALNYFPDARPFLDITHPDPDDGRKRVLRLRRGARPLVKPEELDG